MARAALVLACGLMLAPASAGARQVVWASEPQAVSVTIYRAPGRGEGQAIDRDWPQGFALISETRTVTLPPGEATIRFDGVSEGMIAVSAIVTGLPGGTIERNRSAALLSPAALVDGTLGNRVTITRTNPATGAQVAEEAIVRTRADGALVLQTRGGYEAVRCSGLPETLAFERVPDGLSARPVFSVDTGDAAAGTYAIVLTYLSWGFDWQAHYVADLAGPGDNDGERLGLRSWLTLLNGNGRGFEDARLNVVAGALNIVSDFEGLAAPPPAHGLFLQCYPLGSTAAGSAIGHPPLPPVAPGAAWKEGEIMLTVAGAALADRAESEIAMQASEENLGELKLYRVPEPVTLAANSLKQIAFLDRGRVKGRRFYHQDCPPWSDGAAAVPARIVLETVNDGEHGLGIALPMGAVTMFERGLLVGEAWLRDHAEGQEVEIGLAQSAQVFVTCARDSDAGSYGDGPRPVPMRATIANASPHPVRVKLRLGPSGEWTIRERLRGLAVEDGQWTLERTIPANRAEQLAWTVRHLASGSGE